jgi:hypothetical protein
MFACAPVLDTKRSSLVFFGICIMNAPERILKTHSSDKVAHLFSDPRSATERTRLPSPVSGEAHSVPTHNGFGPDDGYGIKNVRKATIEPNEQGTVGPAQIQSTWCALSKHVQLMTQNQKFSVKPPSRLEAIAHHADEKEGNCDHQGDHVLIREQPPLRRMEFSEATGAG